MTDGEYYRLKSYKNYIFKVPDVYGFGISYKFFKRLTLSLDYVRVEYSDLMEDFEISVNGDTETPDDYEIEDADEFHAGVEYAFSVKNIPIIVRAGYWFNPDHGVKFKGQDEAFQAGDKTKEDDSFQASRIIYSGGEDEHNYTLGLGTEIGRLGINAAGNISDSYDAFSLTFVYRFD